MSLTSRLKKQIFIQAQRVVPQHQLSRVVGRVAASENPIVKNAVITAFKAQYGIDMSIAEQSNALKFKSFNEFFTRALKEGVRDIDTDATSIVSPADGAISQLGPIVEGDIFQAKGQKFTVDNLIADPQLAEPFKNGQFATVYLSPKDYHRVHMPFAGTLTETLYVPGELFSVNQTTADHGFAHRSIAAPLRAVTEQVVDGHGEVVVGLQQAIRGNDAVAVVVRVASEGHVKALTQAYQALHGIRRGRVHADLAVPVDGHEAEGRVDLGVHHFQVQLVVLGNGRPVAYPCPAQRVDAQAQPGATDDIEIDDVFQVGHIVAVVIVAVGGRRLQRLGMVHALDARQVSRQQLVGLALDPLGHVAVGRAAVGRVVLEATALRRVVRRGDDNTVSQALRTATVVAEDGVGNRRRRRVFVILGQHHLHAIGSQRVGAAHVARADEHRSDVPRGVGRRQHGGGAGQRQCGQRPAQPVAAGSGEDGGRGVAGHRNSWCVGFGHAAVSACGSGN